MASHAHRPRRSLHFVPGGNEKMLQKSLATNADVLVLDLEDAVAPHRKDDVRRVVAEWLREADFANKEKTVRMNPLDTPWGLADLEATMATPPDAYLVPKPETLEDLDQIDTELTRLERRYGHPPRSVGLILIVETPRGVLNAQAFAACPRVAAMTWGAEDLAAGLGAASNRDAAGDYLPVFQHARATTLLSACAGGVQAIDTVYVDFKDAAGFQRDCAAAANDGFAGKLSIHPHQIDVINAAFTPSAQQLAEAQALIDAFEEAQAAGKMAFSFNGSMVDAPHLNRAKSLLARAKATAGKASSSSRQHPG